MEGFCLALLNQLRIGEFQLILLLESCKRILRLYVLDPRIWFYSIARPVTLQASGISRMYLYVRLRYEVGFLLWSKALRL